MNSGSDLCVCSYCCTVYDYLDHNVYYNFGRLNNNYYCSVYYCSYGHGIDVFCSLYHTLSPAKAEVGVTISTVNMLRVANKCLAENFIGFLLFVTITAL